MREPERTMAAPERARAMGRERAHVGAERESAPLTTPTPLAISAPKGPASTDVRPLEPIDGEPAPAPAGALD